MTFYQTSHDAYSNPDTQVGAQDNDFRAVSQRDLTRVKFLLWHRLIQSQSAKTSLVRNSFTLAEVAGCRTVHLPPGVIAV